MSTINAVETGLYLYGITDAQDGLAVAMPGLKAGKSRPSLPTGSPPS